MVVAKSRTAPVAPRLTMDVVAIAQNTTVLRSLDWDRDRFDIEFGLKNGTTYNSFLICGDKTALIDSSHAKFRAVYLAALQGEIDVAAIDYLIISHTEPDHSGLVADILELNPNIIVVGAKVALQFLDDLVHRPYSKQIVKSGEKLDLGQGHELEFVSAPNLHWPDTIFTFDHKTQILYTCDAFGMHYCDDCTYDEDLDLISEDYFIYYQCLMEPNARSVLSALKRVSSLPEAKQIATGHGPLIKHNLTELVRRYEAWSSNKAKAEKTVAMFYVSDYGQSDNLAKALTQGIAKTGVVVETMDLRVSEMSEVRVLAELASGIIIGTPPQSLKTTVQAALSTVLAVAGKKQIFGLFEAGGGEDEPLPPIRSTLSESGLKEAFPPIQITEAVTAATFQLCDESGTDLGQLLTKDKAIQKMKSLDGDLDKALGRLSGGLYIITAQKGEASSAMLASWVSQASLSPLGITIAVAKDRAIESFMHVGDRFVLNILEEGNYQHLMRHFLKRFKPGQDRFEGIDTQPAENGAPILTEALSYLECQVVTRLEGDDHWIVYSTVDNGRVSDVDGLTAVHHRKVGNHY
ncbi:MAG: MBL fold metallo-hydrolase [Synechococcales cyanobacterium RM1_1_8]|nr:MBL fold metallo-hydrolase [Synechococcales cyanobacterium RM1_1_8]